MFDQVNLEDIQIIENLDGMKFDSIEERSNEKRSISDMDLED